MCIRDRVGTSSNDDTLLDDTDIASTGLYLAAVGAITSDEDSGGASGEDLIVTFTPDSSDALSDVTAGRVHILLHVSNVKDMAEGLILK